MSKPDKAAYDAAVATLSDADMTAGGTPKMAELNAALVEAGYERITAPERDALAASEEPEEKAGPEEAHAEAPESGSIRLTINDAPSNPVPLYVHGVGSFSLRIGETNTVPREALDALHNAGGVDYTAEEISA